MRIYYLVAALLMTALNSMAQEKIDTLKLWQLNQYSEKTIADLAADTDHWTPMSKNGVLQRYANKVETDGNELKANGTLIEETKGVLIGKGVSEGSLLLRHNMGGSQNGLQLQRATSLTFPNSKKGQWVWVDIKSSSKNSSGISDISSNMQGDCGEGTYPTTSFKRYVFQVVGDGDLSFNVTAGVVIGAIYIVNITEDTRERAEKPVITIGDNNMITITSNTNGAKIFYSLANHGSVMDYAREYTKPFRLNYPCKVSAIVQKEGMRDSEETSVYANVEYDFPYAGKPFVLGAEKLNHGFIATETDKGMLLSWRCSIDREMSTRFNIRRNGEIINKEPLTFICTTYLDKDGKNSDLYTLEEVGVSTTNAVTLPKGRLEIPLKRPAGGTTQTGSYEYVPGDCMVGDVDGDGEYEIIMKWDPDNQQDNSLSGYTGNVIIDGYRMNGEHMWRIDLGKNIRAGAHYTQLMVYDLDGDGKAELACKTAPGTIDGKGNKVILAGDDAEADYRTDVGNKKGVVISGPEYLTVFSGQTGEQLATTSYNPPRNIIDAWGDNYGNRSERYLACVAYLNRESPSLVMCRGYYTASYLWAVDFDGTSLTTRWLHASTVPYRGAYGEGAHSISVADVDGDLCDEIIYGACAIDNDGQVMYRTGWGHGDAMHVGDLMPDRKGLEVMMVHEETGAAYGVEMHDAMTGEVISGYKTGTDVGRGLCADIDATARGCEYWSTADDGIYDTEGKKISTKRPSVNFRTYWDGDVQEEICDKGAIDKWQGRNANITTLIDFSKKYGAGTNLIKYTPCLQADIFGDWREEVIYYDNDTKSKLWIFSTTYDCSFAVPSLMYDHHYRMATIWQTSAYNQPPHLSYFLPDYVDSYATGISDIFSQEDDVVSVRYYNLQGIEKRNPQGGIFIKKTTYANGTIDSKVVKLYP